MASRGHNVLGLFVDGLDVKLAHLTLRKKRVVVEELASATLMTKFQEAKALEDRPALYARINRRCQAMVDAGLIEEVRGLWQHGFDAQLPALRSIGYREIGAVLRGEAALAQALAAMAQATRRLAKRQLTWFRAMPGVHWCDAQRPDEVAAAAGV